MRARRACEQLGQWRASAPAGRASSLVVGERARPKGERAAWPLESDSARRAREQLGQWRASEPEGRASRTWYRKRFCTRSEILFYMAKVSACLVLFYMAKVSACLVLFVKAKVSAIVPAWPRNRNFFPAPLLSVLLQNTAEKKNMYARTTKKT